MSDDPAVGPGASALAVRELPLEAVRPLRHSVLRAGRPFSTTTNPDDARPDVVHLGALLDGEVVGTMTLFAQPAPDGDPRPAARFRGMAVHTAHQGRGIGTALMRAARDRLRRERVAVLWAHGRDTAQGFYERMGFRVVGEGFVEEASGLSHHYVIADVDSLRL